MCKSLLVLTITISLIAAVGAAAVAQSGSPPGQSAQGTIAVTG